MRILLPLLVPAILLSGCASLKPATFEAFRQQGNFAGVTKDCADIRKIAGKKTAVEEVAYQTLRFSPPAGGDVALMEWADTPCADVKLAMSAPGKATWETAAAVIKRLGVNVSEPWAWVQGVGVVYRSDDPYWFGVFDPLSGRVGIVESDSGNQFERPGLIATLPQLDRGIENALAAGKPEAAAALLVQREAWFGAAPALSARIAEKKSAMAKAPPVKAQAPAIPATANPLEAWQATLAVMNTAKADELALLEPELPQRHAAAVAYLQTQIAESTQRNRPATTAALQLQLSSLLGEDAKGANRLAAEESLKRWLAAVLVAAPAPGGNAAIALDWKVPAANTVIASIEDALRLVPAATISVGGIEAVDVGMTTGTGSFSKAIADPQAEALAAQRKAKEDEIATAKVELADAQKRLAALQRAANAGGSGSSQPYGRTDRSYNNKPGGDVYKDTYNTTVYRSSLGSSTVTPEMRLVDMEISSAESTIRIRSQELANLPEPGSLERTHSFPTEEQRWHGKVRQMVTLTLAGFTTTVPAEVDLANYRYSKYAGGGPVSARNDWVTQEQVIARARTELERNFAKIWPQVLRDATLARITAQAGNDSTEAQWGRQFFVDAIAQLPRELQWASLSAAQELLKQRVAYAQSGSIATLKKPDDIGNVPCGEALAISPDGKLVSWCGALFEAETGKRLFQLIPGEARDTRFSADGKKLALYNSGKSRVTVWTTADGKERLVGNLDGIRDSEIGPPPAASASRGVRRGTGSQESATVYDKGWVPPKAHDYTLVITTGTPQGNGKLRIEKGSLDGIQKGQPASVLSKYLDRSEAGRWQVKEVTEKSALLEGPSIYINADAFMKEAPTVVVRGVDLVP